MVEAILYCDRCGRIILPSDRGKTLRVGSAEVCARCIQALGDDERDELLAMANADHHVNGEGRQAGSRRITSRRTTAPRFATPWMMLAAALTAGTLMGAAAVLVMTRSAPPPGPTNGAAIAVAATEDEVVAAPEASTPRGTNRASKTPSPPAPAAAKPAPEPSKTEEVPEAASSLPGHGGPVTDTAAPPTVDEKETPAPVDANPAPDPDPDQPAERVAASERGSDEDGGEVSDQHASSNQTRALPENPEGDAAQEAVFAFELDEDAGFQLTPGMLAALAARVRDADAVPQKLAAMGGGVAANPSFDEYLKAELGKTTGYAFAGRKGLSGAGMSIRSVLGNAESRLEAEKPEIVRICFGLADLAQGRTPEGIRPDLGRAVDVVLASGGVPVLFTLPVKKPSRESSARLIVSYNEMVADLSSNRNVPCVDAFGILNRDPSALRTYFSRGGRLSRAGHDALNERFLELYRILERSIMKRHGDEPLVVAPPKQEDVVTPRAKPPATGIANRLTRPPLVRQKPSAPPQVNATKAATPALENNLVRNGGFEKMSTITRFASRWRFARWGQKGSRSHGRIDKGNPRSGDRALQVRGLSNGAAPGAFTTIRLDPGRYEVRYWACADVGETARVHAHLAGTDLNGGDATEDWQMFRASVEVEKGRRPEVSLRIWTSTSRVRVWFDDVAVYKVE